MTPRSNLALSSVLAILLVLSVVPGNSMAFPYKIQGYLMDGEGNPIPSANISISGELFDPITQEYTPVTHYRETDASGYYVIYVAGNEPGGFPLGSLITIMYDSGDLSATTTVTIEQGLGSWGNLTYDPVTPTLKRIVISPASVNMRVTKSVTLTAQGYDQYGEPISCSPVWTDSSGKGVFTNMISGSPAKVTYLAGDTEITDANITASVGIIAGSAKLTVRESGILDALLSSTSIIAFVIILSTIIAVIYIQRHSSKDDGEKDENKPKRVERRRQKR
jgi:hypothetical protein